MLNLKQYKIQGDTLYIDLSTLTFFSKYILLHFCRDVDSCITIQEEISKCFEFIKTFINHEDFVHQVRNDSHEMKDIEEKLDKNIRDLKRTDCSIVFAGKFIILFCDKKIYELNLLYGKSIYFAFSLRNLRWRIFTLKKIYK